MADKPKPIEMSEIVMVIMALGPETVARMLYDFEQQIFDNKQITPELKQILVKWHSWMTDEMDERIKSAKKHVQVCNEPNCEVYQLGKYALEMEQKYNKTFSEAIEQKMAPQEKMDEQDEIDLTNYSPPTKMNKKLN